MPLWEQQLLNSMEHFEDQVYAEYLVRGLVETPDAVQVSRSVDEMGVLLDVKVKEDEAGLVIGKEGRIAKALKILIKAVGQKNKCRVNVRIHNPHPKVLDRRENQVGKDKSVDEVLNGL